LQQISGGFTGFSGIVSIHFNFSVLLNIAVIMICPPVSQHFLLFPETVP